MTGKDLSKMTVKDVERLYGEGQNIFRRPSVGVLIDCIKEMERRNAFPICAEAYHEELDDQGDRFCRMCGQTLGADQISDTVNDYVGCPQDLSKWVNSDPKIIWFLYDIDLLPETIKTKEQVCGLRGFQYGWMARDKAARQASSDGYHRIQHFDR